jgi:predicted O-methyltransferase YrrM
LRAARAGAFVPDLVREAETLAERLRFSHSCTHETGRLLHVLAGTVREGIIAELGTGCGVGSAWIVSALRPPTSFVGVDLSSERVQAVSKLLRNYPRARVFEGDWHEILPYGPFDLVFVDAAAPKGEHPQQVVDAIKPGGLAILDDLTPREQAKPDSLETDPVRDFWLNHERLAVVEVQVSRSMQMVLACKLA